MGTYLINLDRSADRLAAMENALTCAGIEFERVPAIDGSHLNFPMRDFDERGYRLRHGRRTNPAEVGCFLSHIECAKRLLASKASHALILEDDLQLPPDLTEILVGALDACQLWDILRLSTVNNGRKLAVRKVTASHALAICLTREKGSGAYVINRNAAKWLVDRLLPMSLPYDLAFDLEYLAGLRAMFVDPAPIGQNRGFCSQIQAGRTRYRLAWWQRLTVLPYRGCWEIARIFARLTTYLVLKVRHVFLR